MTHVGIDARILHYNRSGISRFARGLLITMLGDQLKAHRKKLKLSPMFSWRDGQTWCEIVGTPGRGNTTKPLTLFTPSHFPYEKFSLGLELTFHKPKVVHALDFFTTLEDRIPTIDTYYDLYFLHNPAILTKHSWKHYRQIESAAQFAQHILTTSESSKADISNLLGVQPEKITVIYPGTPTICALDPKRVAHLRRRFELTERNILFVGTIEPRKNLEALLHSYHRLLQLRKGAAPDLILVGRVTDYAQVVFDLIKALSLGTKVKYLGELTDADLRALYELTQVFIFPSKYEGFGFPVLEAMAHGIPTVVSSVSSLPEVGGDAAHYVTPSSVESISDGLNTVLSDETLRLELISRGFKQAERFSWHTCAENVLKVYNSVVSAL